MLLWLKSKGFTSARSTPLGPNSPAFKEGQDKVTVVVVVVVVVVVLFVVLLGSRSPTSS